MPDGRLTIVRRVALGCVLLGLLAGCAQMPDWWRKPQRKTSDSGVILGAPEAEQYIADMYRVASGDPATQAEIHADAEAAARITPDPSTRLRLALVLATPGHAESDPDRAQDLFRDLLSQTELMTPAEISLATIHLAEVEALLALGQETERLRHETSQNAATELRAVQQRLARMEAENRQLRQSLAEAEDKLEAITSIERSIREQNENGSNQP